MQPATEIAQFLAGFTAAEGCFTGSGPRSFAFSVAVAASDAGSCERFRHFLGVGHVYHYPARAEHLSATAVFQVKALGDLVHVVVPFMDEHLPPSHKREQYLEWRARLLDYWEHRAKRIRPCTVEGCPDPRRAKGLCRHHYFEKYRR